MMSLATACPGATAAEEASAVEHYVRSTHDPHLSPSPALSLTNALEAMQKVRVVAKAQRALRWVCAIFILRSCPKPQMPVYSACRKDGTRPNRLPEPKHTKMERMWPTCFLHTVGKSPKCRGCQGSLEGCLKVAAVPHVAWAACWFRHSVVMQNG